MPFDLFRNQSMSKRGLLKKIKIVLFACLGAMPCRRRDADNMHREDNQLHEVQSRFHETSWHGHYLQLQQVVSGLFFGNFRPQLFLLTFLFQWPKSVFSVMTVEYFVWTLKSPPQTMCSCPAVLLEFCLIDGSSTQPADFFEYLCAGDSCHPCTVSEDEGSQGSR